DYLALLGMMFDDVETAAGDETDKVAVIPFPTDGFPRFHPIHEHQFFHHGQFFGFQTIEQPHMRQQLRQWNARHSPTPSCTTQPARTGSPRFCLLCSSQAVPPTVRESTRKVGCPTPTGTD